MKNITEPENLTRPSWNQKVTRNPCQKSKKISRKMLKTTHLSFISSVLVVIILAMNTASAVGSETVSIGTITMDLDSTAVVPLSIANAVDIAGISLDIRYDPVVVEVVDISTNNNVVGSAVIPNIDNVEGKVSIVLTNTNLINSVDPIPLINIAVHAIGDAGSETALSLQNVEVTDTNFLPAIPETITNGYVKINDEEKTSFVEQIDTEPEESIVNDEITQSTPVTDKNTVVENDPTDLPTSPSSTTDQASTPGFGFVLTVLTLFAITKINKKK